MQGTDVLVQSTVFVKELKHENICWEIGVVIMLERFTIVRTFCVRLLGDDIRKTVGTNSMTTEKRFWEDVTVFIVLTRAQRAFE